MTTIVEQFMGQPINPTTTTTAAGGDYALYESITAAYLDAQHLVVGSGNDVPFNSSAVYDRPLINYVRYIQTGDGKYLTRGHSGVVGYRDGYLAPAFGAAREPYRQFPSMALHYLYTADATTLEWLGNVADISCYYISIGYINQLDGSSSARQTAHGLEALIGATYCNAPSDGIAQGGIPGGNNFHTVMDSFVDDILGTMSADGSHGYDNDNIVNKIDPTQPYYDPPSFDATKNSTYAYQEALLDEALIHYYFLYANTARKTAILANLIKRENFRWTVMLDQYLGTLGPTLIYLSGPSWQEGGTDPVNGYPNYHPPGSCALAAWSVGSCGFLYNQTADPTYRVRGLQLLHSSFAGNHDTGGSVDSFLTNITANPSGTTAGHHKVFSEITRTTWRAMYYFLNTPAVTHSGVPINTVLPVITQPTSGNLTCSTGTWSNTPTSYSYSWCRRPFAGGLNTVLQTSSSPNYSAQSGDIGFRVFCLVTGTNATGASIIARAIESSAITTVGSGGTPYTGTLVAADTKDTTGLIGLVSNASSGVTKIRLNWQ